MENLLIQLKEFFRNNSPVIIVNTSTDAVLLCLNPEFETQSDSILMKFESLNERGGNSVMIKNIQGFEEKTLYVENEEENILMLQAISVANYRHYIQTQYTNCPDFSTLEEIKKFIHQEYDRQH